MNRFLRLSFALGILSAVLAGCAVGPTYERPDVDVPDEFKEAAVFDPGGDWKAAEPADDVSRGAWWTVLGDEKLNALQEEAMAANQDLKAAASRVTQARALTQGARSGLFPTLDAGFGPTRERTSANVSGVSADAPAEASTVWRAQAGVSYEADLFGRVAGSVDAATAEAQRSDALFHSVLLALQADVAQQYFRIRWLDAEAELYSATVDLRGASLKLVEQRYAEGDISELDVARAKSELESARAEMLGIARQRAEAEHGLAILLGRAPADFSLAPDPLVGVTTEIPAGLPSALLERRPDIAAAERAMAAANARIGVAKAAFFPRLNITGGFGYASSDLGDLLQWSSRTFLLGPLAGTMLSLPIFDGGRRQAELEGARARYEEDVARYRQTILQAFKEVEDSLSTLRILKEQRGVQAAAVDAADRAAQLSLIQYQEGSVSFLDVIDADRMVLQQKSALLQLDGERAHAVVDLIRAIGGGWADRMSAVAVAR